MCRPMPNLSLDPLLGIISTDRARQLELLRLLHRFHVLFFGEAEARRMLASAKKPPPRKRGPIKDLIPGEALLAFYDSMQLTPDTPEKERLPVAAAMLHAMRPTNQGARQLGMALSMRAGANAAAIEKRLRRLLRERDADRRRNTPPRDAWRQTILGGGHGLNDEPRDI